ncbi:Ada DNA repair metal-binding [Penicillium psychrosexuale]|uniref:Ada DNA repair metal-binding n=1 Tax=Penicillium psychrosexuale TaxID=1002107 RepID=UPI002545AC19|nr:Ada DNA repair metal-binding [Penicillium psychrosexuale]KAJ5791483.1 Ada DNA repair metal-binding [Penicillium psychrosexuale]
MKRGLKKPAQEVGVMPSYLCREENGVYARSIHVEAQSSNTVRSGMGDAAINGRESPMAPVEDTKAGLAEQQMRNVAEVLDLNFFWTGERLLER